MSKKALLPQSRRHILVYDEDWSYLQQLFGMDTDARLGVSGAIRQIIHAKCRQLRERELARRDARQSSHQPPATEEGSQQNEIS